MREAIVIGPHNVLCSVDSAWFQLLLQGSILLPYRRLTFREPGSETEIGTKYGTFVCYLGPRHRLFAKVFGAFGTILKAVSSAPQRRALASARM